jgi:hypothetical protein
MPAGDQGSASVGSAPPATDERVLGTIDAIQRELTQDGLVDRSATEASDGTVDGLPGKEGAFLPCSFWLADGLPMAGPHSEARALFERLLSLRNDLGLLSEEYDVDRGRMVGNFPQAFMHLALVGTAHRLDYHRLALSCSASKQRGGRALTERYRADTRAVRRGRAPRRVSRRSRAADLGGRRAAGSPRR